MIIEVAQGVLDKLRERDPGEPSGYTVAEVQMLAEMILHQSQKACQAPSETRLDVLRRELTEADREIEKSRERAAHLRARIRAMHEEQGFGGFKMERGG